MNAPPRQIGSRPRIGYLFSRYPVVSHTFIDNEMLALEQRGWQVAALSLSPPKDDFRHTRLNAFQGPALYAPPPALQKTLPLDSKLLASLHTAYGDALDPEKCLRNATSLAPLVRSLGVSHMHVHFANRATYAALILKHLTGIPFSFTPQAADFLADLDSPRLLRGLCSEASFIVVPCHFAARQLARLCPESEEKFVLIYNGIDPSPYPSASPALTPAPLRLVSVGRLVEFKGFHHAIEAVAIAGRMGVAIELRIQGDGPWRGRLEALAQKLGVAEQVIFEGTVGIEVMRRRFAESDAFVLACTVDERGASDMLPTVITEAMLCGLPVVSCPVAGVPEQVVDGQTGFLTPSNSPHELASAFARLANQQGLARALGQAARARALDLFSQSKTLPLLEEKFLHSPTANAEPNIPSQFSLYDIPSHPSPKEMARLWREDARAGRGILLAGSARYPIPLPAPPKDAFFLHLPDGMALEMEWQSLPELRAKLEPLSAKLAGDFSTEACLAFARRALWTSRQLPRIAPEFQITPRDHPSELVAKFIMELA